MIQNQEEYILLFVDNFTANLAFIINREVAVYAMKVFGNYSSWLICSLATLAVLFAYMINYFFGKFLYSAIEKSVTDKSRLEKNKLGHWIYPVLMCSFIPFFGKFVPVFAGLLRENLLKVLIISTFSKSLFYIWLLYLT